MLVLPTVFSSQTQGSLDIPQLFPEQCLTKLSKNTPGTVALPWNWNESGGRHQAPPSWQLSKYCISLQPPRERMPLTRQFFLVFLVKAQSGCVWFPNVWGNLTLNSPGAAENCRYCEMVGLGGFVGCLVWLVPGWWGVEMMKRKPEVWGISWSSKIWQ